MSFCSQNSVQTIRADHQLFVYIYVCVFCNQSVLATASPLSSASVLLASLSVSASDAAVVVVMASFEVVVTVEVVVVDDEACEAKLAELLLLFC